MAETAAPDYCANADAWRAELACQRDLLLADAREGTGTGGAPCYTVTGKIAAGSPLIASYSGLWFFQSK